MVDIPSCTFGVVTYSVRVTSAAMVLSYITSVARQSVGITLYRKHLTRPGILVSLCSKTNTVFSLCFWVPFVCWFLIWLRYKCFLKFLFWEGGSLLFQTIRVDLCFYDRIPNYLVTYFRGLECFCKWNYCLRRGWILLFALLCTRIRNECKKMNVTTSR